MAASIRKTLRPAASVGAFHAKSHLSQLLERVSQGEESIIAKHHRPVARLVPAGRPARAQVTSIFQQIDALRQSLPGVKSRDKTSLKGLIEHGRRS
jgi:prevent-host-death family protein